MAGLLHTVSIHASVKDATSFDVVIQIIVGFNPRVREGRDCRAGDELALHGVSIHASVKDATCTTGRTRLIPAVSIHASVKDATSRCTCSAPTASFNPRVREGRDGIWMEQRQYVQFQSTRP